MRLILSLSLFFLFLFNSNEIVYANFILHIILLLHTRSPGRNDPPPVFHILKERRGIISGGGKGEGQEKWTRRFEVES